MNNSLGDYENKLDLIIRNIKNNNKIRKTYKNEDNSDDNIKKKILVIMKKK